MTATFQSLRDTRLPKATKAVGLLANLVRYAHTEQEAKDLVNDLGDAIDDVDAVFAKKWGWEDTPDLETPVGPVKMKPAPDGPHVYERRTRMPDGHIPSGTAQGGATFEAEIAWAIDAIKRNDNKLAVDRLTRVLKGQTND